MDLQNITQQLKEHDIALVKTECAIEDLIKDFKGLPEQLMQKIALENAKRDEQRRKEQQELEEQRRKEQREIKQWQISQIVAMICGGLFILCAMVMWVVHERDQIKEDHILAVQNSVNSKQALQVANQADHKSDQALNGITKMNDKLDLVIYFHKKDNRE